MEGTGPHADVVLSSRIRLARNLDNLPFPQRMSEADAAKLLAAAEEGLSRCSDAILAQWASVVEEELAAAQKEEC